MISRGNLAISILIIVLLVKTFGQSNFDTPGIHEKGKKRGYVKLSTEISGLVFMEHGFMVDKKAKFSMHLTVRSINDRIVYQQTPFKKELRRVEWEVPLDSFLEQPVTIIINLYKKKDDTSWLDQVFQTNFVNFTEHETWKELYREFFGGRQNRIGRVVYDETVCEAEYSGFLCEKNEPSTTTTTTATPINMTEIYNSNSTEEMNQSETYNNFTEPIAEARLDEKNIDPEIEPASCKKGPDGKCVEEESSSWFNFPFDLPFKLPSINLNLGIPMIIVAIVGYCILKKLISCLKNLVCCTRKLIKCCKKK